MTRLAVFYYSELPDEVGPVRSMRASDIGIVSPVDGVRRHQRCGRPDDRPDQAAPASSSSSEGAEGRLPRQRPERAVQPVREPHRGRRQDRARTSGAPTTTCPGVRPTTCPRVRRRTRSRRPSAATPRTGSSRTAPTTTRTRYAADGDEFPADTVLVLRVPVGDAGYLDPAGNPVPGDQARRQGRGAALPRRPPGARHLEQERPRRPLTLSTKAGKLDVPAGHTWIELVPAAQRQRHLQQ